MTVLCAPLPGRIVGRRGPRLPLTIAGACLPGGCLMLTGLAADAPLAWLLAAYVVFGVGFGVVKAPITNAAVSGMPRDQAGVAAAVTSTSRQVGQALGVAVAGAIVASRLGASGDAALASASHRPGGRRRAPAASSSCSASSTPPPVPAPPPGARRRSSTPRRCSPTGRDAMSGHRADTLPCPATPPRPGWRSATSSSTTSAAARSPRRSGSASPAALSIDPPNATVVVDELEDLGLVGRGPHPSDGRAKLVEATPKGRELARRADEILATPPPGLSALDGEDLATLRRILAEIAATS